ncbi:YbaB/EbfC family nucleoid-associated protein [Actinokineospora sp. NPDC004072]
MFTPLHNDMTAALAELREQQAKIADALGRMASASTTAATDDRMVSATVDGRGRLTAVAIAGRRWRELAPGEFAARVVEAVNRAQDAAAEAAAGLVADLMPAGVDLDRLRDVGPDLSAMVDAAVDEAGRWGR